MTCTATATAAAGQYQNLATATGTSPTGPVQDTDPSHYFGEQPSVEHREVDERPGRQRRPGPFIPVGDPVAWTYVVTNTGNVQLTDVTVADDQGVPVAARSGILAPGDSENCFAGGTARAGQYANVGSVDATSPSGQDVTDSDPSHYFGVRADIDIEKSTNGNDADQAPGPRIPVGDPVTWTYVVTNTGNVA